ncbi:MAG: hypothetical protein ACR5LD_01675 [Symbiopectobacterium sp.]
MVEGGLIGSFISRKVINILSLRQLVLFVTQARVLIFFGFLIFTNPVSIFVLFVFKPIMGIWNVSYNAFTLQEMPLKLAERISAVSGTLVKISAGVGSLVGRVFSRIHRGRAGTGYTGHADLVYAVSGSFVCKKRVR